MENPGARDVLTKNVKKDRVMEALASEYECINYVVVGNVLREPSIRYRISKKLGECIPGWLREMGIYERFDLIKNTIVVNQEREAFAYKTKREVILENLRNAPVYFVNFRANVLDKLRWQTGRLYCRPPLHRRRGHCRAQDARLAACGECDDGRLRHDYPLQFPHERGRDFPCRAARGGHAGRMEKCWSVRKKRY